MKLFCTTTRKIDVNNVLRGCTVVHGNIHFVSEMHFEFVMSVIIMVCNAVDISVEGRKGQNCRIELDKLKILQNLK